MTSIESRSRNHIGRCFWALVISSCLLAACQPKPVVQEAAMCAPAQIDADASQSAPRPPESEAGSTFSGNMPEQLEFVFIQPDGRYHYAERWDFGIPHDQRLQLNVGWDWKVHCQIERCEQPAGQVCCFQICEDGGNSGVTTEPPDQFGCMNAAAGGQYQWFLDGLQGAGIEGLEGCAGPPASSRAPDPPGGVSPGPRNPPGPPRSHRSG